MADSGATSSRQQLAEQELAELRARFRALVEGSPLGIFFDDAEDRCVFVNTTFCTMMELSPEEALGDGWVRTVHPDDLDSLLKTRVQAVADGVELFRAQYRYRCRNGRSGWVEEQTRPVHGEQGELLGYVGTLSEITDRKEAERSLERLNQELETRVRERTSQLQAQTERLAEMNAALRVLLRQRDEDRSEMEQAVLANVRRRILPCLDRLEASLVGVDTRHLLDDLRVGLNELTDPFSQRVSTACLGLTPTEFQVVGLIRQGLTTKEIASRLGVGASTIDTHRNHIRRKLGLDNRKTSLRAYLLSLDPS